MRSTPAVAVAAALAVVVWWRLRIESHIWVWDLNILNYDSYAYYFPTFRYGFGRLARGEFPWWNPYQLCGTPFFATGQHLLLYPLNFFYLLLPTPSAMKCTAILHFALAIVFTFVCGRVFGLSRSGALTAGTVFAFSGSLISLLYVPHHLYGAVWMPLVLALAEMAWTRPRPMRWGFALGVALACQYLGGYPMYSLFSAYLVAGHLVWRLAAATRGRLGAHESVGRVAAIAFGAVLALVLSAPQLLPAVELARQSPRNFGALDLGAADPAFGKRSPAALVGDLFVPREEEGFPVDGYVGLAALLAVALAPLAWRRTRATAFFCTVALLAWLLAFGTTTPLYRLYFHLPTASWFRRPERFLVAASLACGMLAGVGVDALRDRGRTARLVAIVVGTALVSAGAWRVRSLLIVRPILSAHLAALAGLVLAAGLGPGTAVRRLVAAFPLLVYLELLRTFVNIVPIPETHPHFHDIPAGIVDYLRAHQGFERVYLVMPRLTTGHIVRLPAKAGMTYGLYTIADRENVYAERYQTYVARMEGADQQAGAVPQGEVHVTASAPNRRLLDLLGVRFVVEGPGTDFLAGTAANRFPVLYAEDGIRVRANPAAVARVLLPSQAAVEPDPDRVLDRLTEQAFDPATTVVLEEAPDRPHDERQPPGPAGVAEIVSYAPEEVVVRAHVAAPAWLVLTDQAYPGWDARVDGRATRIYRADYLFRAVALDAGEHEVVFRFRPTFLRALVG